MPRDRYILFGIARRKIHDCCVTSSSQWWGCYSPDWGEEGRVSETSKKTKVAAKAAPKGASKAGRRKEHAFPRVRIRIGDEMVLGPGKVDLLEAIGRTGSISAAGRELGMSYRRAWLLVDALNHMFPEPLVTASPGGSHGGGAKLTDYGRGVAAAYRRIEERTRIAMREELAPFKVCVDRD